MTTQITTPSTNTPYNMIYYTNDRIGVGITNPIETTALQIEGTGTNNSQFIISDSANTKCQIYIGTNNNNGNQFSTIQSRLQDNGGKPLLLNPNGGNVGIGTDDPKTNLNVWGKILLHNEKVGIPANGVYGGNEGTRLILWPGTVNTTPYALGINDGTLWYGVPNSAVNKWFSGTTNIMTLDNSGNLSVSGYIRPSVGTGNNGIIFPNNAFGGSGDAAWIKYYTRGAESTTFEIGISNDGDDHIALMPSGNVGIGNNNPSQKLDVTGNIIGNEIYTKGWFRNNHPDGGLYNENRKCHFYPNDAQYGNWKIHGNAVNGWNGLRFTDAEISIMAGVSNGSKECGFHYNGIGWGLYIDGNRNVNIPKSLSVAERVYFGQASIQRWEPNNGIDLVVNARYFGIRRIDNGGWTLGLSDAGNLRCNNFWGDPSYTFSDERIKSNITKLNTDKSLEIVNSLNPKSFLKYDENYTKNKHIYGLIAQDVKDIIPECVYYKKQFICNINDNCIYSNKKIIFNNDITNKLSVNDKIKFVFDTNDFVNGYVECSIKNIESPNVIILEDLRQDLPDNTKIYVYGKEIDDFHTIDYSQITALNISAIQELHKIIKQQSIDLERQSNEIKKLYELCQPKI